VLAIIVLLLFGFATRAVAGRVKAHRRRKEWIHALDKLNRENDPERQPHEYLAGLNRLFRAVALKAFPGTVCARLKGDEWVAFVASLMPEQTAGDCLLALASGPYEPLPEFDARALDESARIWVKLYG